MMGINGDIPKTEKYSSAIPPKLNPDMITSLYHIHMFRDFPSSTTRQEPHECSAIAAWPWASSAHPTVQPPALRAVDDPASGCDSAPDASPHITRVHESLPI